MAKEQENMVTAFGFTLFFLALSLVGTYGIFMNLITAIITSTITIFGIYSWYIYSLKLYNRFKYTPSHTWTEDISNDPSNLRQSQSDPSSQPISMQGDLTIVEKRSKVSHVKLTRRYFVLRQIHLDYYSDERAFELHPTKHINKRPIELQGYQVRTEVTDSAYALTLVADDPEDNLKEWELRCDTADELGVWSGALSEAVQRANNAF